MENGEPSDFCNDEIENNDDSAVQLDHLAHDYSKYTRFDVSDERNKFTDNVEEMLTKLDEFRGLVDMVRSDTSLCLYRTLPEIQTKCQEMEKIFTKVDQLETFIAMVKQNLGEMEEAVNKAEEEMGMFSGIRKMLNSVSPFRSSKKPPITKPSSRSSTFEPPDIYETDMFFPSSGIAISVLKVDETGKEVTGT